MAVRGLDSLNELEIKARDYIVLKLKNNIGKANAVSNGKIRSILKSNKNWDISDERIRAIILSIRDRKLIRMLASGHSGYYVAKNELELSQCINSLKSRVERQQKTIELLEKDLFDKRSGVQMQLKVG